MPRGSAFRVALARLQSTNSPEVQLLAGDCPQGARLAVMSGSFNPPTRAHLGLARAALATGRFDRLCFALAVRTINKEQIVGATLEERCAMLAALAGEEPRHAVLATNRGLYLEQAQTIRAAFAPRDLAFVVGFDKIVATAAHPVGTFGGSYQAEQRGPVQASGATDSRRAGGAIVLTEPHWD
jgi:hypothetical protein